MVHRHCSGSSAPHRVTTTATYQTHRIHTQREWVWGEMHLHGDHVGQLVDALLELVDVPFLGLDRPLECIPARTDRKPMAALARQSMLLLLLLLLLLPPPW